MLATPFGCTEILRLCAGHQKEISDSASQFEGLSDSGMWQTCRVQPKP